MMLSYQRRSCIRVLLISLIVWLSQLICTSIMSYLQLCDFGSESQTTPVASEIYYPTFLKANRRVDFHGGTANVTTTSDNPFEKYQKHLRYALSRVKTQQCKDTLIAVGEKQRKGTLYADHAFQGTCPHRNISNSRFVGCFRDKLGNPDLSESKTVEFAQNTPLRCVEHCYALGLAYAAVQRKTCNCGDRFGSHGALPQSRCVYPCPGNATLKCGGNSANSIYTTETGTASKYAAINHLGNGTQKMQAKKGPLKIAFILSLNGRAVRQIGRILRLIYRPQHYYYIHVDARAEYLHMEMKKMTKDLENVHVADFPERYTTIWAGASHLTMLLSCYRYLYKRYDWIWDYVVNLSESDMPIRPVEELESFLGINANTIFLQLDTSRTDVYLSKRDMHFTFVECENRMWRLDERPLPRGVRIFGESDWLTLPRDFVKFVLDALDSSNPSITILRNFFGYTIVPIESFFHTVAMNSHFCDKVANNNLRFINWRPKRGCRCQHIAVVDRCGCSPNNFVVEDTALIDKAMKSGYFFIARKFEEAFEQKIVNMIEIDKLHTLKGNEVGIDHFWLNEFSSESDSRSSTEFLNRQPYYQTFAAMTLELLVPKAANTTNCPEPEIKKLLSANSLRIKNDFQALLVEFSAGACTFEAKAVFSKKYTKNQEEHTESLDTINNAELEALSASWGFRVAEISVGSDFDVKEGVFRNAGSLLVTRQEGVCLLLKWEKVVKQEASLKRANPKIQKKTKNEDAQKHGGSFEAILQNSFYSPDGRRDHTPEGAFEASLEASFTSPDGNVLSCSFSPQVNEFIQTICECEESLKLEKPGVWQVQVENAGSSYSGLKFGRPVSFVVLDRNLSTQANLELIKPDFWSIDDVCVVESSRNDQDDCFAAESLKYFKPCTQKSWSSHSADVKSLPKFQHKGR